MPLSHAQILKLKKGKSIQLKHEDIEGSGFNFSKMAQHNQKKINSAYNKNKGVRVSLSAEELTGQGFATAMNGEGVFGKSFDKLLKKGGIKKGTFATAKVLQPIIPVAGKTAASLLVKAGMPGVAVPVLYGTNMADEYSKNPTMYQKKKNVGRLFEKSAQNSAKDIIQLGVNQAVGAYMAPTPAGKGFTGRLPKPGWKPPNTIREPQNTMQVLHGRGFAKQSGTGFALTGYGLQKGAFPLDNQYMMHPMHPALQRPRSPVNKPTGYKLA